MILKTVTVKVEVLVDETKKEIPEVNNYRWAASSEVEKAIQNTKNSPGIKFQSYLVTEVSDHNLAEPIGKPY